MNQVRGPADTRAALVKAGRKLFSSRGFHGTSVRDLTDAARVNLGAITYHFGGKDGLYQAVIEATVSPMAERLMQAVSGPGTPLDRAERFVRAHFTYLCEHPELPRLMIRGVLDAGKLPRPASAFLGRVLAHVSDLIREGQRDGTIRQGLPVLMASGLVSQSLHLTLLRGSLLELGGIDLADPVQRASVLDDIVRSIRGGLAARGEEPA